ncbi:MAG: hypothetical protein JO247_07205 [Chloroflexi bacterium]|nr:hypothetical protein [Chloroflexota bacterium]
MVERRVSPEDLERMLDQGELDYRYELELVDGEIIYLGVPSLHHNAVVLGHPAAAVSVRRRNRRPLVR